RLQSERQGPHGRLGVLRASHPRGAGLGAAPVDEVDAADPADFTLATMPQRFATLGDRHAGIDATPGSLEQLLELSARHERDVLVDRMRGRSSTWTRIRVNLRHVPPKLRPRQERLDPDEKTLESS